MPRFFDVNRDRAGAVGFRNGRNLNDLYPNVIAEQNRPDDPHDDD